MIIPQGAIIFVDVVAVVVALQAIKIE